MDRQTLRDWVHRYNAHGVEGLRDVPRNGRPPAVSAERTQKSEDLVLAGPDLKEDGVVRWRCVDLRAQIKAKFEVEVHERTVGKLLRLTRLQPRPYHPKADPAAQEAHEKLCWPRSRCTAAESGRQGRRGLVQDGQGPKALDRVGQQGTLSYVWAPIGSRPARVRDCRHESAYLFGAVCPSRAVGAAIVVPWVSSEAMTLHLAEVSKQVATSAHALLVCDGAG